MNGLLQPIINRQDAISKGEFPKIPLPKHNRYTLCNLRGGIGKTTLAFNLSYLGNDVLAIDTCPQGNLSFHFDNDYYARQSSTVRDLILPYLIPGLGKSGRVAVYVGATNNAFKDRSTYYIPSSSELYLLPSQLISAINQASGLTGSQKDEAISSIVFSLKHEIERELKELNGKVTKYLIDTSPFFAGATQLAWYASDALIIPVRTDEQSIKSLELMINTLTASHSEFNKYLPKTAQIPKIQMVVLTHCGWSTKDGARNIPNSQTILYLSKVFDILNRHRTLLSTDDPANHLFMLDDFLGSGRIASAESKPLELLMPGQSKVIKGIKVKVNKSVYKCKFQLQFINQLLWNAASDVDMLKMN